MSIAIQKLHKDEREVGKNIKGTKKYYVWEFVLNNKFHKIEIFHSKITGKKKLCLDAQKLVEDQGYQSSFTYSFKIDKHYFTLVQGSLDLYELRIDNRLFENLMLDERSGRLKQPVSISSSQQPASKQTSNKPKAQDEPIPEYLRTVDSYKRNNDDFYDSNDNDFDFSGGKSNSNNYAFKKQEEKKTETKKKQESQLLDFNDIADIKKAQQNQQHQETGQSSSHFQANENTNAQAFQHNQNIFNSINIFDEKKNQNDHNLMLENIFSGSNQNNSNSVEPKNNQFEFVNNPYPNITNQNNNFGNIQFDTNLNQNQNPNQNIMTGINVNMMNVNTKTAEPYNTNNYQNQMNFGNNNSINQFIPNSNSNPNVNMNVNMNMGFGEIQSTQPNRNSNLNTISNNNINQLNQPSHANQPYSVMTDNTNASHNLPLYQSSSLDYNSNIQKKESSPFTLSNSNNPNFNIQQQYQPFQNQAQDIQPQPEEKKNDFKVHHIILHYIV